MTEQIFFGAGVLGSALTHLGESFGRGARALCICDNSVWDSIGRTVERRLAGHFRVRTWQYDTVFRPSVSLAESIPCPEDTRLVVSVGGGSTADLARWVATAHQLPTAVFCTSAAPAYCLLPSVLIARRGLLELYRAAPPTTLVVDLDCSQHWSTATMQSGLACVATRAMSVLDWQMSARLWDTPFCQSLADQVTAAIDTVRQTRDADLRRVRIPTLLEQSCRLGLLCQLEGSTRLFCGGEASVAQAISIYGGAVSTRPLFGTSELVAARVLCELYAQFLGYGPSRWLPPPYNVARIDLVSQAFEVDPSHVLTKLQPCLSPQRTAQLCQCLLDNAPEWQAQLGTVAALLGEFDIGHHAISPQMLATAIALAPDIREKLTALTAFRQGGYLESLLANCG